MPPVNPLIAQPTIDDMQPTGVQQAASPGARATGGGMNPAAQAPSQTTVNAAGSSENVAIHVAMIVAFALIGIYVFRQSGFKFVVGGSIGIGS